MFKLSKLVVILAASSLFSFGASAELVPKDWATTGDQLISYDTKTNLNWLDLSFTLYTSYNEVLALLDTDLSGWRLASETEVATLFNSSFTTPLSFYADGSTQVLAGTDSFDESVNFTSFFGSYQLNNNGYAYGLYKDDADVLRMTGVYATESKNSIFGMDYTKDYEYAIDVKHEHFATYLVSNDMTLPDAPVELTVPLPASVGLLGLALAGFGLRKRKNDFSEV